MKKKNSNDNIYYINFVYINVTRDPVASRHEPLSTEISAPRKRC